MESTESAAAKIDEKIKGLRELGDWRGVRLAQIRELIHAADPEIVEEWKWVHQVRLFFRMMALSAPAKRISR
jgi:hypothetical protein